MGILIEHAKSSAQLQVIRNLETEIFGGEKGISLPPLSAPAEGKLYRLLARDETTAAPMATLSVAEGEMHPELLRQKICPIRRGARVARLTRLAVCREYRGKGIHLRLLLEAHQRFIGPQRIRYTWFLYDAARRSPSLPESMLRFQRGSGVIESEFGPCYLLFRDEFSLAAWSGNRNTWACIDALEDASPKHEAQCAPAEAPAIGAAALPPAALPPAA